VTHAGFVDPECKRCEDMMQTYLDRELTESEHAEAEGHLGGCNYCRKRYRFETTLRLYVRQTCFEAMDPALKAKLVSLRTPLL
jgi:anti-sigma factor (TIGR02949 family)